MPAKPPSFCQCREREKTGFDVWRARERERGFEVLPASGTPAL